MYNPREKHAFMSKGTQTNVSIGALRDEQKRKMSDSIYLKDRVVTGRSTARASGVLAVF